ncbi:MAG TPA: hypothetical protein VJI12_01710 [archaeon]|nr:hypothetical protein [archaeon]
MFEYRGRSERFKKTIEDYGPRLEKAYKSLLRGDLNQVSRLDTPGLYYTPLEIQIAGQELAAKPVEQILADVPQNPVSQGFFLRAMEMVELDETITRELDRRMLGALGYENTRPWVEQGEDGSEISRRNDRLRAYLSGLSSPEFMDVIKRWDTKGRKHGVTEKLLQHLQQYRVQKIRADDVGGAENIHRTSESGVLIAKEKDNTSGMVLLSPERDKIRIQDDGTLQLVGTSRIVTAPAITLTDDGVDVIADYLKGTDVPPHLVSLVHEFDHFVGYCLARYPLSVVTGLFYLKAMEK